MLCRYAGISSAWLCLTRSPMSELLLLPLRALGSLKLLHVSSENKYKISKGSVKKLAGSSISGCSVMF